MSKCIMLLHYGYEAGDVSFRSIKRILYFSRAAPPSDGIYSSDARKETHREQEIYVHVPIFAIHQSLFAS